MHHISCACLGSWVLTYVLLPLLYLPHHTFHSNIYKRNFPSFQSLSHCHLARCLLYWNALLQGNIIYMPLTKTNERDLLIGGLGSFCRTIVHQWRIIVEAIKPCVAFWGSCHHVMWILEIFLYQEYWLLLAIPGHGKRIEHFHRLKQLITSISSIVRQPDFLNAGNKLRLAFSSGSTQPSTLSRCSCKAFSWGVCDTWQRLRSCPRWACNCWCSANKICRTMHIIA